MNPVVLLGGAAAIAFGLSKLRGGSAPLKVPPKPAPGPIPIDPHPIPLPPHPVIGPIPPLPPSVIDIPPNTIIPSPLGANGGNDPSNGVIVNPQTPAGNAMLGQVVTQSTGASGRLFVHNAMDTTTGSRVGFLEHGEVVRLLSSEISPNPPPGQPGDVSWYHVQKLDGSLDGFADASFISEDVNNGVP